MKKIIKEELLLELRGLDDFITGTHDPNAPFNQTDWVEQFTPILDACEWLTDDVLDAHYDELGNILYQVFEKYAAEHTDDPYSKNASYEIMKKYAKEISNDFLAKWNEYKKEHNIEEAIHQDVDDEFYQDSYLMNSPLKGMRKQAAVKYLYNNFDIQNITKKIYSDDSWQPIHQLLKSIDEKGINILILKTEYYKTDGIPTGKIWWCAIPFINQNNKKDTINFQITAAGAGSVKDPLDRYDVTVVIN